MRIDSNLRTGMTAGLGAGLIAAVRDGETRLSEVAERLGVPVEALRAANPLLKSDVVTAGQMLLLPVNPGPADQAASTEAGEMTFSSEPSTPAAGDPTAKTLTQLPPTSTPPDPRFTAIDEALQAGNGQQAMKAAKELLALLQKEKPPQPRLLNQARMSLAAGGMLAGDLDAAQKSLLAVNKKALERGEVEQYGELLDLLKNARQDAYSIAFQADADTENGAVDKGKTAASEAASLAEILQKTNPENAAEISEARLKQANALLMGGHYRDAGKALKGIDEKSLDDQQKEYLGAVREGINGQFIEALSKAYGYDMKRKNFKDAATNATVMVNNLAKHFPDNKDHLVVARLQQATAQIMNGDMEDARKSLGRLDRDQLKQMEDGFEKRYKALNGAVLEHFENVKKEQALKAEAAAIEAQVTTINRLTSSGNKADATKAVFLAEQLLANIKEKYPANDAAIAGARLTLANAKLAADDMTGANADLQAIADTAKDPAIRDRAHLLQARVALKENQTDKAVRILHGLINQGATPELRKAAKEVIISLEAGQLKNVQRKAEFEQERLEHLFRNEKTPQSKLAFANPLTSLKVLSGHYRRMGDDNQTNINWLGVVSFGAGMAGSVMKSNGLTLAELQKMPVDEIARLPRVGAESANAISWALNIPDVKQIARDKFDNLSWQNNTWYVDASYLDSEVDKAAQWIGKQVRQARSIDEEFKESDSLLKRAVGYTSGAILDAVSASNEFVKGKIKNASDFYNDPERKDTWYAALGRAGTFGADVLTMPLTMPATIADYKASDAERSEAITGTLLMAGTLGVIRGGGPAWKSMGSGASRIATSRLGKWVATSEFGQLTGRAAQKLGNKAAGVEARFEATSFATGMDKMKASLRKLNPEIRIGGPVPAKTIDEAVDDIMDAQSPAQWRTSVTEADMRAKRAELREYGFEQTLPDDQIRRMVIGDRIYATHYNPAGVPKPATITQSTFEDQLRRYEQSGGTVGRADDYWHRRYNKPRAGETQTNKQWMTNGEVRRFYFNVKPDDAAGLADHLASELNRRGLQFQFKMPSKVGNFTRADAGILYVEKGNHQAVREIVQDYARKHPNALVEGYPAFTKPIGKGIAAAEEPIQAGLPVSAGGHSFGTARSDIIAEAIVAAPPEVTKAGMKKLVRQRLWNYGFDPDRPWLKQRARVDDLARTPGPGPMVTLPALGLAGRSVVRDPKNAGNTESIGPRSE